ncbi:GIY-YIG nuclease family protein [Microbacterium sp. GXS0129]|uniref:GIY-YIG nuclease family protein n=1 Tax=Microbacterium sp. GXS0129 TaxID=3377836 RepID=UPI00383BB97E
MPKLPAPCLLCRGRRSERADGSLRCARCGWRFGDAPDPDLPPPRVDVVYYLRWRDRIKIGTSANPRQRLAAITHEELLAFERGDRILERERHEQFAPLRLGGEWFSADETLRAHALRLRGDRDPWDRYVRWFATELAAITG